MTIIIFSLLNLNLSSATNPLNLVKEWTDADMNLLDETGASINRLFLFYADWCSACRRYKPQFHKFAPKLPPSVEIIQINLDKAPLLGSRFRISHLPSLFHQLDADFRKADTFQGNLDKYFEAEAWQGVATMGPLSPPKIRKYESSSHPKTLSSIYKSIERLGVSVSTFVILFSTLLLFIAFFIIWCIWLYTDYKLNSHNFTKEAVKERIKFLRQQPQYRDEFGEDELSEKDDNGNESDSESESESESSEDENEISETAPLRGRRSSLKNRLK